jgi:MoxR-like ATPase
MATKANSSQPTTSSSVPPPSTTSHPTLPQQQQSLTNTKTTAASYFAWAMNMCLCSGASGLFVDLIPEDGCIREFAADEESILGQSLERMALNRFKGFGTVSRVHCGEHTSPEVFYVAVAHAVRTMETAAQLQKQREEKDAKTNVTILSSTINPTDDRGAHDGETADSQQQQQPELIGLHPTSTVRLSLPVEQSSSGGMSSSTQGKLDGKQPLASTVLSPHIFVVQDLDRAPARTLECLTEMLAMKTLSAPPGMTVGVLPDMLHLPPQFLVVASSSAVPKPSTTTTFTTDPREGRVSDRLMNGFFLRIPIILPKSPPPPAPAPPKLSRADLSALIEAAPKVHLNASIVKYVRNSISAVRAHSLVACGLPPRAADVLCLAIRTHAALRGSRFAIPEDLTTCVIEVLAHRIIVAPADVLPIEFADEHPVYLARMIIAAAISSLPVIR